MVDRDALSQQVDEMRRELAGTPAEVVVANHCYGLFELAAVYLSQEPPLVQHAQLAIDALGAVVDGLRGRLGEAEPSLREGLSRIRLASVEIDRNRTKAEEASGGAAGGDEPRPPGHPGTPNGASNGSGTEGSPTT